MLIREATCETDGKLLEICARCGQMKTTTTPKGEHKYSTHNVAATCTSPGYTVKECSVCGDRHITNITSALPHNYKAQVTPVTMEAEDVCHPLISWAIPTALSALRTHDL